MNWGLIAEVIIALIVFEWIKIIAELIIYPLLRSKKKANPSDNKMSFQERLDYLQKERKR